MVSKYTNKYEKCECGNNRRPYNDKCWSCRAKDRYQPIYQPCECGRRKYDPRKHDRCWDCRQKQRYQENPKLKICECGNRYNSNKGDKCWYCKKSDGYYYRKNPKKYEESFKRWYLTHKEDAIGFMMNWRRDNIDWYRTYQRFYHWLYVRGIKLGELTQEERTEWCEIYFGDNTPKCPEKRDKHDLQ